MRSAHSPGRLERSRLAPLQWLALFVVVPSWVLQLALALAQGRKPSALHRWLHVDFSHYYVTAHRVLSGAQVYCAPFTEQEVERFGLVVPAVSRWSGNPPALTMLLAPLGYLSPLPAWSIYQALSLLATLGSLLLFVGGNDDSPPRARAPLLLAVTCSSPLLSLFAYSQVQGLMLAVVALAIVHSERRPLLAGACLGLASALKLYTLPLVAFALFSRRYRLFAAAALCMLLFSVLPQAFDARLGMVEFLRCSGGHVAQFAKQSSFNQSLVGVLRSLGYLTLLPTTSLGVEEIQRASYMLGIGLWLASGAVLGVWVSHRLPTKKAFSLTLAVGTLCAPVAWPHYYVFVWPYLLGCWRTLSIGQKLILWFAFPLVPTYLASAHLAGEAEAVSSFWGSWLVWAPSSVFFAQLAVIVWRDLAHGRAVRADQPEQAR